MRVEVILTEAIPNLGVLGDCVKVRAGYARNFLVPKDKAMRATAENKAVFEAERKALEKAEKIKLTAAESLAETLNEKAYTITANAGEAGKLFGSIGARDIAEHLTSQGTEVAKHQVRLPHGAIRELGEHDIVIHLHADVDATVKLTVVAE